MMPGTLYHAYCDESSQTKSRFMVYGGIIIEQADLLSFDVALQVWRNEHNMHSELKWTKVSDQKEREYIALADLFFKLAARNLVHFKSVVFDTTRLDYRRFFRGNHELGFYRFYHYFLLHKFASYATSDADRLLVFLDERTTEFPLDRLQAMLNKGIRRHYRRKASIVRKIEPVVSKKCGCLQVADVLMGAIAYHYNDLHLRPDGRKSKAHLAEHITQKAGLTTLACESRMTPCFEIWPFRLK